MPIKIGRNHVATFHRGDVLRRVLPQLKDQFPADVLAPRRTGLRGLAPRVEISRVSDETRFASGDSVRRALARIPLRTSIAEVTRDVSAHVTRGIADAVALNARLPGNQQKPIVVVFGEYHDSRVSLAGMIATLGSIRGHFPAANAPVLFEIPGESLHHFAAGGGYAALADARLRSPQARQQVLETPLHDEMRLGTSLLITKTALARGAGFALGAFDRGHFEATDNVAREAAMVDALRDELAGPPAPVRMIVCGCGHMSGLHRELSRDAHLVPVVMLDPLLPDISTGRKSASHALARDDILCLRVDPEHDPLEARLYDPVELARAQGLTLPAAWTPGPQATPQP